MLSAGGKGAVEAQVIGMNTHGIFVVHRRLKLAAVAVVAFALAPATALADEPDGRSVRIDVDAVLTGRRRVAAPIRARPPAGCHSRVSTWSRSRSLPADCWSPG